MKASSNKKKLNIGFYLPDLSTAENSGSLTFFNFFKDAFIHFHGNYCHNFFLLCEDSSGVDAVSKENLQILNIPKTFSFNKISHTKLIKFRLGSWARKIANFFYISWEISSDWEKNSGLAFHPMHKRKKFEDFIDVHGIDIMIYANQFVLPTVYRPYVWILWDLGCKTINFFHQMGKSEEILEQLRYASSNAFRVITGSQTGEKEISQYLNFPNERIRNIPFPVSKALIKAKPTRPNMSSEVSSFLFYPALLTPFKNHAVLLDALKILHQKNIFLNLVLSGYDKGNIDHIIEKAKNLEIDKHVHYLGVVSLGELKWLYQNAEAMVFPSLLGPNNFPPIEAMALGTPCIVSNIQGHIDQLEENALFFDPLDSVCLAEKIERLQNDEQLAQAFVKRGLNFTKNLTPENYFSDIIRHIDEFTPYRANWNQFSNF